MNERQKAELLHHLAHWQLSGYSELEIHHGDCIGADAEFHDLCLQSWPAASVRVVLHPPTVATKRAFKESPGQTDLDPLPYLQRNHAIVDSVDAMLGAPKGMSEELRSGTWATIRYSRKRGVPLRILWPQKPEAARP